eukprot:15345506-Alexandrium_andersonii.AAC.1
MDLAAPLGCTVPPPLSRDLNRQAKVAPGKRVGQGASVGWPRRSHLGPRCPERTQQSLWNSCARGRS